MHNLAKTQYKTVNTCIGEIKSILRGMNQADIQIVLRKFVRKHNVRVYVYVKYGCEKYSNVVYCGNLSTKFVSADHIFTRIVEEITNVYTQTKVV